MNRQDLTLILQSMEALRKAGGYSFDVMPMVSATAQKLSDLLKIMNDGDTLALPLPDGQEERPKQKK